jgi:5-methylcytosine-specific restriction endonuclease McrA
MCRGKNSCNELGVNPEIWPVNNCISIPKEAFEAVDHFKRAVNLFLEGNRKAAIEHIDKISNEQLVNWFIEHGQMSGRHRKIVIQLDRPSSIPFENRDPVRSPSKLQNQVFERDGYTCRYCGIQLVSQVFLKKFIKVLDYHEFRKGKTNLEQHAIIHFMWPVADHVVPWNLGGRTSLDNLVSSCATCNYGKDGYTLEEIQITNPFQRSINITDWKGFSDKIDLLNM